MQRSFMQYQKKVGLSQEKKIKGTKELKLEKMAQEVIRKGPWTDNEDSQLVSYVNLFGDRRWDFIAKVSGLKRTGKSCRLRWVNYLHPGLRRGKMTPREEQLVLELHANWGNRWSRIARKLPGRTDNEIKNYWRTYMRKKAQEMKKTSSPPSSCSYTFSSSSSSSSINGILMVNPDEIRFNDSSVVFGTSSLVSNSYCSSSFDSMSFIEEPKHYDMGGIEMLIQKTKDNGWGKKENVISMDDIFKDIELSESKEVHNLNSGENRLLQRNYGSDSLWLMGEEGETRETIFTPIFDHFNECYGPEGASLTY